MSDGCGFDILGDLDVAYLIRGLFKNAGSPWIAADDCIEFWKVIDDIIFPIIIAFHVRQRIDGKFHSQCVQYFGDHRFPFFVGEWIFGSMFLVGRSDPDEKFSYSVFSCLFECIYMSEMERLKTTDKQPYFFIHRKILGIKQ